VIGVDTNVLVRYLVQDDPAQSEAAAQLLDARTSDDPAFISLVTLCEVAWVLRGAYRYSGQQVVQAVRAMLASPELTVEQEGVARRAVVMAAAGADFPDAVVYQCARQAGCTTVMTFDRVAARRAGMTLLAGR
jgi:predicted nucleic-acid-binding protein